MFKIIFSLLLLSLVYAYEYNSIGKSIELVHNQFRINADKYGPEPISQLNLLNWSNNISESVQRFVNKCEFKLPDNSYGIGNGYSLFKVMNKEFDPVDVLNRSFVKSAPLYDWSTASCKDNQCCDNYATMIWNTTTELGCASSFCIDPSSPEGGYNFLACGYYPIGNFVGVKPYTPKEQQVILQRGRSHRNHSSDSSNNSSSNPESQSLVLESLFPSDDIDWVKLGFVTKVKDQKNCGGCYAFSVCAALESAYLIKNNLPNQEVDLSEQSLISCTNLGCNGGNGQSALDKFKSDGILYENDDPYLSVTGQCQLLNTLQNRFKYSGYSNIKASKDNFIAALKNGPIYAAVYVDDGFQNYKSGVYSCSQSSTPNHAITLVGFSSEYDAFLVKNSWGTSWGTSSGLMYLKQGSCNLYSFPGILVNLN